jgi:hypothetical protein
MKTLRLFPTLAISLLLLNSCDDVKDLLKIPVPFSLEQTIPIVALNSDAKTYTATKVIQVSANADISSNFDNIKSYEIESLSYTISDVATITSPSISGVKFIISGASDEVVAEKSSSTPISESTTQLDLSTDSLEKVKNMVANGENITIEASATVVNGPVSFDLTISIIGKIQIGA